MDERIRKPGHAALRKGRISQPGLIYHVTTTTADRQALFVDLKPARIVARGIHDPSVLGDSRTLCWVAMPDHLHWLLELGSNRTLSALVGQLKAVTGKQINQVVGRVSVPVWAPSFHDHALRRDEDLEVVARYIVGNPIRAGLCESEREYPHWDCVWDWSW